MIHQDTINSHLDKLALAEDIVFYIETGSNLRVFTIYDYNKTLIEYCCYIKAANIEHLWCIDIPLNTEEKDIDNLLLEGIAKYKASA